MFTAGFEVEFLDFLYFRLPYGSISELFEMKFSYI